MSLMRDESSGGGALSDVRGASASAVLRPAASSRGGVTGEFASVRGWDEANSLFGAAGGGVESTSGAIDVATVSSKASCRTASPWLQSLLSSASVVENSSQIRVVAIAD